MSPAEPVDELPAGALERLRWAHAMFVTGAVALTVVPALADPEGDVPALFGALVIAATGVPVLFVVRYYLRRPLETAGVRDYAVTVAFRNAAALVPTVAGLVMAFASGTWWLVVLGGLFSMFGLAWSVPSQQDYQRHRSLAVAIDPHPADEVWGDTPPGYVPPWDAEPGHGHGLRDH